MERIIVKTQAELDALPAKFETHTVIEIRGGVPGDRIIVRQARENSSVEARENSSVVAQDNSSVEARENSSVVAQDNSSVAACDNSSVEARDNSSVMAWDNSSVSARDNSSVSARENSSVVAQDNSSVEAWGNSSVVARDNSSVMACDNSSVEARENSSVETWDNSSVEARENSSVVAWDNSSVVALENSSVVAWDNSSVEAYEFATLVVFSAAVVAHLADRAVARLRGVKPKIERKDDSATVLEEPELLNIPFETWLERGYVVADGLRAKHISTKQVGNATVYTVRMSVLDKEDSYVVRVGDKFAHGRTIDQAVKDIRYKIADRDTTRFKSWKKDDERSLDELIEAYRAITGACEFGTRHFVESQGELPERLTVARAIELTRGQYNSKRFEEFFEA